jgi:FHS family glucose/mannose:H+ symporter-like MFS transporter
MYLGLVLTGLGTMLLGPILPLLSHQWGLTDAQSGLLLLAQFCGSFTGGFTVSSRLRRDLLVGFVAAAAGLGGFALSPGLSVACVSLFIGGAGVGRTITAINILAGQRFTTNRGPAIMLLNFTWSFGAMLSPLLAAWLTPVCGVRNLLLAFAGTFAVCAAILLVQARGSLAETHQAEAQSAAGAPGRVFLFFCGMMVLYGGLETCLNGWLTTFALRYGTGDSKLARGELTLLLLLIGLTAGRGVASYLLLRMREVLLQRISLALSAVFTAGLATAHTSGTIAGFAVLLGLSLAPVFPSLFSLFMGNGPTARQAGVMMAVSALGAAALPWLMGVVSTATGSLQVALALPCAAALAMLVASLVGPGARQNG